MGKKVKFCKLLFF